MGQQSRIVMCRVRHYFIEVTCCHWLSCLSSKLLYPPHPSLWSTHSFLFLVCWGGL